MTSWFVRTYDHIYGGKDYRHEAERVSTLVRQRFPAARTLLDVACGTGRHLEHLRDEFSCTGVDVDEEILAVASSRLPGVPLHRADMVGMDLGGRFDVVVCLFSAVGYVETSARLERAIASMVDHLTPGGVLVVEPWVLSENWRPGGTTYVHMAEVDQDKVLRVSASGREGDVSILDFHYVWARPGAITTGDERHRLGLFAREDYLRSFALAGLDGQWIDEGLIDRGLVIGQAG